jgi:hypothetical protein
MSISLIPWFIFWVLLGLHEPRTAALAACLAIFVLAGINLLKGRGLKLLQIATLVYFVLLSLTAFFIDLSHFWLWVRISSSLFLGLVVFFSIILGKPFTLQYAREKFPKEKWSSIQFIETNYAISWVWCGVFFLQLLIPLMRLFGFNPPKILGPAFSILAVFAALKLTKWYSKRR